MRRSITRVGGRQPNHHLALAVLCLRLCKQARSFSLNHRPQTQNNLCCFQIGTMAEEGDNSSNVPPRILQMKETPWSNERIYPDPVADRMKARFFQQTQLTETPNCFKLVMQQSALL